MHFKVTLCNNTTSNFDRVNNHASLSVISLKCTIFVLFCECSWKGSRNSFFFILTLMLRYVALFWTNLRSFLKFVFISLKTVYLSPSSRILRHTEELMVNSDCTDHYSSTTVLHRCIRHLSWYAVFGFHIFSPTIQTFLIFFFVLLWTFVTLTKALRYNSWFLFVQSPKHYTDWPCSELARSSTVGEIRKRLQRPPLVNNLSHCRMMRRLEMTL